MKRFIVLLFSLIVCISSVVPVFANNQSATTTSEISYNQYIELLSKTKGLSKSEAIAYDKAEIERYEQQLKSRISGNSQLIKTSSLNNALATANGYYTASTTTVTKYLPMRNDLGATASITTRVYVNGSFREIVSVLGSTNSYITSGSSPAATWNQTNAWAYPSGGSFPTTSVSFGVQGRFQVVTRYQLTAGATLGLTFQGQTGQDYYYRSDIMSIEGTKGVY